MEGQTDIISTIITAGTSAITTIEEHTDIISAIITAGTSVITTLLGIWLGKIISNSSSSRGVREQQLSKLYKPLEICLTYSTGMNEHDILAEAEKIIISNLELVHEQILFALENAKEDISQLWKLRTVVSSHFNWTRRRLGYPYESFAIRPKYKPITDKEELLYSIPVIFVLFISSVSACLVLEHFFIPSNQLSPTALRICCSIAGIGFVMIVLWFLHIKM